MSLEFAGIHHAYGGASVLRGIDLSAAPGKITCLLGESGCGKTTLLRLAAGLLDVQRGEIRLDGALLAGPNRNPPPEKRPVGLVFQEGALFPHLTVARNIAFGLGRDGDPARVVPALLRQIGLDGYGGAYPHTLSGGQQQRVALARALAPEPAVILLDEPFASIDVVRRRAMREETRRLLRARGAIAILVTHDPEEAVEMGDRVAVMAEGAIVQAGTPETLYDGPASVGVALLFGDGQHLTGRRTGDTVETPFGSWPAESFRSGLPEARDLDLVIRPDAVMLAPGGEARIEDVRINGSARRRVMVLSPSGSRLAALVPRDDPATVGQPVAVRPAPGAVFAFPANASGPLALGSQDR